MFSVAKWSELLKRIEALEVSEQWGYKERDALCLLLRELINAMMKLPSSTG